MTQFNVLKRYKNNIYEQFQGNRQGILNKVLKLGLWMCLPYTNKLIRSQYNTISTANC